MSHGTDKPSVDARRAERLARAKMLSGHFASRSEDGDEEPPRKKPQRGGASGGGISFNVSGAAMPAGRGMAMRGRGIAGRGAGGRGLAAANPFGIEEGADDDEAEAATRPPEPASASGSIAEAMKVATEKRRESMAMGLSSGNKDL